MLMLYFLLLLLNCVTEYQFHKIMQVMDVLENKKDIYHKMCAVLRMAWIFLCAWFAVPVPVLLMGLLVLLFCTVMPYRQHLLLVNSLTVIIYLMYITLFMLVTGCAGLAGYNVIHMEQNRTMRVIVLIITFIIFNVICFLVLRFRPGLLWREDDDRFKVVIYTRFLFICVIYHLLDSVMLTLYHTSRINYFLLVSGDILILILMFNFLNYNYVFSKSEEMKREYENNQVLLAQQFFEKETLKKLSEFDSLTDAYNRREISSIMRDSIKNGHRLICVFTDLDGLKRANDKYGHTFGDLMLKRFADACVKTIRGDGYLARIGGDEFLLVFLDQEVSYVENCIKELQLRLIEPEDEKERIYFSYGLSYDEESVDNYIISADQRMYACKNRKRCDEL
ncbi:MAG: GGDEF domain-containing protein [Eubacteriales bacterium]|nr:GGDEF domain-containing protein [Eubacteriales bacterium]